MAVNGTFVPEILVDPNPRRTAEEASKTAVAKVETDLGQAGKLSAVGAPSSRPPRRSCPQGLSPGTRGRRVTT